MFDCLTMVTDPKLVVVVFCCVDTFCSVCSLNYVRVYTAIALVHTYNLLCVTVIIIYMVACQTMRTQIGINKVLIEKLQSSVVIGL